jgi:hypothetical protein
MKLIRAVENTRIKSYLGEVELTSEDIPVIESEIIIDKTLLKHLLIMVDKYDPQSQKIKIFKTKSGTNSAGAIGIQTRRQHDEKKNHVYALAEVNDVDEPGIPTNYMSNYPKVSKKDLNPDLPILPMRVKRGKQPSTEFYIEPRPDAPDEED